MQQPVTTFVPKMKTVPASVTMNENDLEEQFCRGSGPGGQSINKSMNRVRLVHKPTGIAVAVQDSRDLTSNRKIARKTLKDKIDYMVNGDESKLGKRILKKQRRKSKAKHRSNKKYGNKSANSDEE